MISNVNCPATFTRAYQTSYMTCTFRIDSVSGNRIWYSIDWNGDGVAESTTSSTGYASGQTHTQSKACSTSTCSAGVWNVTVNARTVGVSQWWADPKVEKIVLS